MLLSDRRFYKGRDDIEENVRDKDERVGGRMCRPGRADRRREEGVKWFCSVMGDGRKLREFSRRFCLSTVRRRPNVARH